MTIIVWDGKTLAADKQVSDGDVKVKVTKIRKIRGALCGAAGDWDYAQALFNWFKDGAIPDNYPDSQKDKDDSVEMLVITSDKRILKYEQSPYPMDFTEAGKHACGSGAEVAYGAMVMGADAIRAVEVASEMLTTCGMGVDTLTFEDRLYD